MNEAGYAAAATNGPRDAVRPGSPPIGVSISNIESGLNDLSALLSRLESALDGPPAEKMLGELQRSYSGLQEMAAVMAERLQDHLGRLERIASRIGV